MKRYSAFILALAVLVSVPAYMNAVEADETGASPGKWTMDFGAAQKAAAKEKLPILLNFSGSDWCGWCKLMEKNVFAKEEWGTYAKKSVMMVLLDYPQDKSLVPERYVERNEELKAKYEIEGFPTFVLLDDDGKTVLGRLGAGQDKTPESFIAELEALTRYMDSEVERYEKKLKPKARNEYRALVDQISKSKQSIATHEDQIQKSQKEIKALEEEILKLESDAQEFRAAQLGETELKKYKETKEKAEKAAKELAEWLSTEPDRTEANMKKYQGMSQRIQELHGELGKY